MYLILCVWVFGLHVCLCTIFMLKPTEVRREIRSPGTRSTDGCEPPHGYWDSSPGPLEEQPVPLTTEPSLQPQPVCLFVCLFFLLSAFKSIQIPLNSASATLQKLPHGTSKSSLQVKYFLTSLLNPLVLCWSFRSRWLCFPTLCIAIDCWHLRAYCVHHRF